MKFLMVLHLLTLGRGEGLISVYSASRRSNIDWGTLPATPEGQSLSLGPCLLRH